MKKTIYIKPRQSGKTSQVINLVGRTKGHILILCPGVGYSQEYRREFKDDPRIVITYPSEKLVEFLRGRTFEFVIIDEFMNLRHSISTRLYEDITKNSSSIKNLYMIGTPNAFVSETFFNQLKIYKNQLDYDRCWEYFAKHHPTTKQHFDYWFFNFMTDHDVNLVKDDFYYSMYSDQELLSIHGSDAFNVLYRNKIFT